MKKRFWIGLMILIMLGGFLSYSAIAAETGALAVFAEDTNTDLYLNGELFGKGTIKKEVSPGTYFLSGKLNGKTIYNESVTIRIAEMTSIRVVRPLESKVLDVRHFGAGLTGNGGTASGFHLKWYPGDLGVETIIGSGGGDKSYAWNGSTYVTKETPRTTVYEARVGMKLKDALGGMASIVLGVGKTYLLADTSLFSFTEPTYETVNYAQALIVVNGSGVFGMDDLGWSMEFGYKAGQTEEKDSTGKVKDRSGLSLGFGLTYWLN